MFCILYGQVADSISDWYENYKSEDQSILYLLWVGLRDLIFLHVSA